MLAIASNNRICCHDYHLITTSRRPTYTHSSTNSETAIQLVSLKYNLASKSHSNVKVHMEQNIQEWTKSNLWKIAFKKFEGTWSA